MAGVDHAGGSVLLADVLRRYPCAVLEKTDGPDGTAQAEQLADALDNGDPIFRATPRQDPSGRPAPASVATDEGETETTGLLGWLTKRFFDRTNAEDGHG